MKKGDLIQLKILPKQPYAYEYLSDSDINLDTVCEIIEILLTYNNKVTTAVIKNLKNDIITEIGVGFMKEHFIKWERTERLNYLIPD